MESAQSSCTDSDTLECSVCSELFTEPKLLPCAHILCRLCLVSWLSSSKEAHCPLCRAPVVDASHKVEDWEKVVDAIPTDISMTRLVRSKRVLSESHECKGCQQTQAVSICLHCGDMLCRSCTSAHGNLTATRHHKVEDLSTMTAERMSVTQPATCGNHTDKPSELYCPTHGAAICHLCASSEHRACPEVTLFEKHVAELYKELASMSERLKSTEEKMDVAIKELDQELEEAGKRTQETLAEINAACNRLDLAVRECRKRLEKLTKESLKKVEQSLQASRVILSDRRGRLRSHRRVVDRVKRCAASGDLDEASLVMKKRIEELDLSIISGSNLAPTCRLIIDPKTVPRLVRELSFLGEQRSTVPASSSESSLWRFLDLSKDVLYSEDCLSAEKMRGHTVIVLSQSPMITGMLYEVRIDEIKGQSGDYFPCGVVGGPISTLTLPRTALRGWDEAIVFCDRVYLYGKEANFDIDDRLKRLNQGTRVGFVRDSGGFLHLYIDGKKQWVYTRNAPTPCYVFFELLHIYQKVTALPLTSIQKVVNL